MSIFAVNNFNFLPKGLAIYAAASRLNHSCVPNTHHGCNPNIYRFTVHAARDIVPGEELTINYMGQPANFMVRSQRVEHLRTNYGFTCTCVSCSDRTTESDTRRDLLNSICWGLQEYDMGAQAAFPFIADGPSDAFKLAVNAVNFLNAEGLQTTALMTAMSAASKHALAMQDWPAAYHYALREEDVEVTLLGKDIKDLEETGAAASCWTKHVRSVIKGTMGVKKARKIFYKENGQPVAANEANSPAKTKKKTAKTPQRNVRKAELAREREEQEPAKEAISKETTESVAGEVKSGTDVEKTAEISTWAKVVAGGKLNGGSTDESPQALSEIGVTEQTAR